MPEVARCSRNGPSVVTKVALVSTVHCTETGTSSWLPWILLALLFLVSQAFPIACALETGAMDYTLKPYAATELVPKVRSELCRKVTQVRNEPSELFALGNLTVDLAYRDESVGADWNLSNRIWCGERK